MARQAPPVRARRSRVRDRRFRGARRHACRRARTSGMSNAAARRARRLACIRTSTTRRRRASSCAARCLREIGGAERSRRSSAAARCACAQLATGPCCATMRTSAGEIPPSRRRVRRATSRRSRALRARRSAIETQRTKPGVLHVLHSRGGGTEKYVQSIVRASRKQFRHYFLADLRRPLALQGRDRRAWRGLPVAARPHERRLPADHDARGSPSTSFTCTASWAVATTSCACSLQRGLPIATPCTTCMRHVRRCT